MPSLKEAVFDDPPLKYSEAINPYLKTLKDSRELGDLPIRFGQDLKSLASNWDTLFSSSQTKIPEKLIMEIGIHKGVVLTQMAKNHTNYGFLGLDITYKRVVSSAQKLVKAKLSNAFCLLANAKQIRALFADQSLDGAIIFFPDPWSKKPKQSIHRLITEEFAQHLYQIIKPDGFLWLKTDDLNYFQSSRTFFEQVGFEQTTLQSPLSSGDYSSVFEERFAEKSIPTYSGVWMKRFPADEQPSL